MLSGFPRTMSRIIGLLMCLVSIIWGYNEHQAGTMSFGPLTAFLGGAAVFVATFDATDALLRKLVSKSTSEEERSAHEKHNRQAMLNRVRDFWVKGVLESSLHEGVRIGLGLEEHRDAVAERPWDVILRTPDRPDCKHPPGTKISDVFERVGRSLLILGEPGAGKTTTLLELAREMIDRAEKDPSEKIPVVFNLSSWTDPTQTIADWLAVELRAKYNIPKKIAATWVENDSLLLLLDGLDEVASVRRAECVEVINGFLDEHLVPVAVCCRKEEYEALDARLKLQSAILLQPLTPEQIDSYLEILSPDLDSLREVLRSDQVLQEFAKTPLILSIMILAYRGISAKELQSPGSTELQRRHLFKTYVGRMFERTTRIDPELYPKEKTIHWLYWLAQKMEESNQTVFLIERMQPCLLDDGIPKNLYVILVVLVVGLIGVLGSGSIGGLVFGPAVWLMSKLSEIKPVERLNWSWKMESKILVNLLSGGLIFGLIGWMTGGLREGLLSCVIIWLWIGLTGGGLSFADMETRTLPNQGIIQSAKNSIFTGLILGLLFGLIDELFLWHSNGLIFGLIGFLIFGGLAVIQHFTLRFVLHLNGLLPWKLVPFLDYASERIFLRKVGGGYVFVHRMLMEYFASLEPAPGGR